MLEREMEDLLWNHPEKLLNQSLERFQRQMQSAVGRADLVFANKHGELLVVEIKRGNLERDAIAQLLDYFGDLQLRFPRKQIRLMIVANKISKERRLGLERVQVLYLEIPEQRFRDVASEVGYGFESEEGSSPTLNDASLEPPIIPQYDVLNSMGTLHCIVQPQQRQEHGIDFDDLEVGEYYMSIFGPPPEPKPKHYMDPGRFPFFVTYKDEDLKRLHIRWEYLVEISAGRETRKRDELAYFWQNPELGMRWEHFGNKVFNYPLQVTLLEGEERRQYLEALAKSREWTAARKNRLKSNIHNSGTGVSVVRKTRVAAVSRDMQNLNTMDSRRKPSIGTYEKQQQPLKSFAIPASIALLAVALLVLALSISSRHVLP